MTLVAVPSRGCPVLVRSIRGPVPSVALRRADRGRVLVVDGARCPGGDGQRQSRGRGTADRGGCHGPHHRPAHADPQDSTTRICAVFAHKGDNPATFSCRQGTTPWSGRDTAAPAVPVVFPGPSATQGHVAPGPGGRAPRPATRSCGWASRTPRRRPAWAVTHAGLDDECRGRRHDEKADHENGTGDQEPRPIRVPASSAARTHSRTRSRPPSSPCVSQFPQVISLAIRPLRPRGRCFLTNDPTPPPCRPLGPPAKPPEHRSGRPRPAGQQAPRPHRRPEHPAHGAADRRCGLFTHHLDARSPGQRRGVWGRMTSRASHPGALVETEPIHHGTTRVM